MPKSAKPKKYTVGLQTILYDRGVEFAEREIDGMVFTAKTPTKRPDIYHFKTAAEGDFYLLANGDKAPGSDAEIAKEFESAEVSKRAPKD